MNRVYWFYDDNHGWGNYFAAPRFKEAKMMAIGTEITDSMDNPFIEIKGTIIKKDGKPVTIDHEGVLSVVQCSDLGILWFECENADCCSEDIKITKELAIQDQYMCLNCGYVGHIPYGD